MAERRAENKRPCAYAQGPQKKAAAYSPTWCSSTIGADGLNFPVRNGKGWAPSPWPPKIYGPRRAMRATLAAPRGRNIVDIIMGQGVPWKQATERVRVRTLEKKKDLRRAAPKKGRRAHCASQRAISTTRLRTSLPF